VREFLKTRPELAREIEAKIMEAAGITVGGKAPAADGDDA